MRLIELRSTTTILAMACLMAISCVSCKPSMKSNGKPSDSRLPVGWPADVPIMPGLELVFAERVGDFLIVKAKGTAYPPDIAQFYKSLPGWTPEPDWVSTWDKDPMPYPFKIQKGDLIVDIQIRGEHALQPYTAGQMEYVELACYLH